MFTLFASNLPVLSVVNTISGQKKKRRAKNKRKYSFSLSLFISPKTRRIVLTFCVPPWSTMSSKNKKNLESLTTTDENVEKVLVNGVAEIKCDVSSSIDGDQVLLVVWYKNNLPIYR
jgi:hypothetical protein